MKNILLVIALLFITTLMAEPMGKMDLIKQAQKKWVKLRQKNLKVYLMRMKM